MHLARFTGPAAAALFALGVAIAPASASQVPVLIDAGTHGYAYPNCPTTQTQDTVTISNISSTETLSGWLAAEQVVPISTTYPDGRRIIQKFNVNWTGPSDF